ncbi:MAG TPA: hypothetical protein VLV54_12105 [Thermoanaerobaculia bacterium]|nr:hypothetical protein [Thermoanaerobaculia bacterium]
MEELQDGVVFRLATVKHDFPPDSSRLRFWHFELSQNDRSHAEKTGNPPRLSVFDSERTTVAQALAIRGVDQESVAFGLRVPEIRVIRVASLDPLRVVRDPLETPLAEMPGAGGHCGIEGLARRPGDPKALVRELRVRLSDLSFPFGS